MAKKRDIIIGVVIAFVLMSSFMFMMFMFIGLFSGSGDFEFAGSRGNVGVIRVFGTIDEELGRKFIDQVDDWVEHNSIKAIVVHINSPGGGVAISQEMYDAIERAKDAQIPVVASMASVAASGGYYIACAADRIVANPGTLTGSIGVIFQFYTAENLMDKIGIATETIKSGELKDVGSLSRSMTKKEELMLKSVVMDTYEQFIEVVSTGRNLEKDDVYPLADGSIFTGYQAYNLGLVDSLGGLNEAIDLAADIADITGDIDVIYPYERKKVTIFDVLGSWTDIFTKTVEHTVSGPQLLYLYQ